MKPALVISEKDNVATALEALDAGRVMEMGGTRIVLTERIASGHKFALVEIDAGEPVVKYGSAIGLATAKIAPGQHVHTHNVASSRGRGDLATVAPGQEPPARLAEPVDPANGGAATTDSRGGTDD